MTAIHTAILQSWNNKSIFR